MKIDKRLADGAAPGVADRWYVTDGDISVGPVGLDLIARGMQAGKVPPESFVRNEAWTVWRPAREVMIGQLPDDGGSGGAGPQRPGAPSGGSDSPVGGGASFDARKTLRCGTPVKVPARLLPRFLPTDDVAAPARPADHEDWTAADAFAGAAADEKGLLLLLLAAAVQAVGAEGAIVHEVRDEGAVVVCAHGPNMFAVLGERAPLIDGAVMAAAAGLTVVAGAPDTGPAGEALLRRLARLGVSAGDGAGVMIPIRPHDRLLATLEVGRGAPFHATEVAALEALVAALVARLDRAA